MNTQTLPAQTTGQFPLNHGYAFSSNGVGREIDAVTAADWLKHQHDKDGEFIWLHFHDLPGVLEGWPLQHVRLPDAFADTLREGSRSTRITHVNENLIAVLNDVDYDFARKEPLNVATLWLNVGVRCLMSVRSLPLRSVSQLRQAVEMGTPFHSPMALLIHLLQEEADVLVSSVRTAAQTVNEVDATLAADRLPKRPKLGGIRRDLVRLRRLLAPEPAALFRLVNRPPNWVREEDVQSLRQSAEEFSVTLSVCRPLELEPRNPRSIRQCHDDEGACPRHRHVRF
ncbi:CorA family divalent cation transporter [Paraburkholderia sp. Cpub6]|uniref:CorA family divalent cation transporter n=1 Tax=Paraburkholderia sp. Cpub6 TaxID=2723094 RepID=UPI00160ABB62|nr:CorA family divalent cation transporter [Paraburkholderia sp. Cpub6]MBB5462395.1 zinc transporter [Paraburkholderia sp. Cpub6]